MAKPPADTTRWNPDTKLVRGGTARSQFRETSEGLFLTSGFVYDSAGQAEACFKNQEPGFVYSRFSNPTVRMFEDRLAMLEGAQACRATASGMAAVFSSLACQLRAGERIVAARSLFGSCQFIIGEILPRWGIESVFVDGTDTEAWRKALSRPTKAVFLETPSNPTLEIVDLKAVADLAHKAGARVVVDNVFASPMLQKPLAFGADVVVYSATKHIDGQGRVLGGAVLGTAKFVDEELTPFLRHTGPAMSPFNAWVLLKGLETLGLRMDRHCENARRVAAALEGRPGLAKVLYPGLASHPQHALAKAQMRDFANIVVPVFEGGKEAAFRFLDRLALIDISNNLGDAKSLATHPATTTHQRLSPDERAAMGISDGMVRLSIGLEDVNDILADLENALRA